MKKIVIIGFFVLLCIPFIAIKTIFPFYRFGMFAEPINTEVQTEKFFVFYQDEQKNWQQFDGTAIGISRNVYAAMMRKYHYQQQGELLLEKTASLVKHEVLVWEMWRVSPTDSVQVGQWQP